MKRRIQEVKEFEVHLSTSTTTYELQLHNGRIYIYMFMLV